MLRSTSCSSPPSLHARGCLDQSHSDTTDTKAHTSWLTSHAFLLNICPEGRALRVYVPCLVASQAMPAGCTYEGLLILMMPGSCCYPNPSGPDTPRTGHEFGWACPTQRLNGCPLPMGWNEMRNEPDCKGPRRSHLGGPEHAVIGWPLTCPCPPHTIRQACSHCLPAPHACIWVWDAHAHLLGLHMIMPELVAHTECADTRLNIVPLKFRTSQSVRRVA